MHEFLLLAGKLVYHYPWLVVLGVSLLWLFTQALVRTKLAKFQRSRSLEAYQASAFPGVLWSVVCFMPFFCLFLGMFLSAMYVREVREESYSTKTYIKSVRVIERVTTYTFRDGSPSETTRIIDDPLRCQPGLMCF